MDLKSAHKSWKVGEAFDCLKTGDYIVDGEGVRFTRVGLVEVGFLQWVRSLHGISAAIKSEIVKTGGVFPIPREMFSTFGETLAGVLWSTVRSAVSRLYIRSGASKESVLQGVLTVINHYTQTRNSQGKFTLVLAGRSTLTR